MDDELAARILAYISSTCGWLYFIAWSVSFYPQPLLNLRRRTTQGLAPDFPLLNVVGFAAYTFSSLVFLYSPVIRAQYASRHPLSPEPTVRLNDLAFALHALLLCIITYSQFLPGLWGWEKRKDVQRCANKVSLGLIWGSVLAVLVTTALVVATGNSDLGSSGRRWAWIDVIYAISYIKLLLTVFKYIPQVISNFRRKSTVGWSIVQVLLDFSGGILSLTQLVIDSSAQGDWSGLTGNPVKFGLANVSLIFDVIFILQHYLLYGPVDKKSHTKAELIDPSHAALDETSPLLPTLEHAK